MSKILMLGWEYPPHISGGLGTACQGLTQGLSRQGEEITFILPRLFGDEPNSHMNILAPKEVEFFEEKNISKKLEERTTSSDSVHTIKIDSSLSPYLNETSYLEFLKTKNSFSKISEIASTLIGVKEAKSFDDRGQHYGNNIFEEVNRYASLILHQAGKLDFDVIHAHDWMTFPAGIAVAKKTGKPLLVHVHSLEYDRSGLNVNELIRDIEQSGVNEADGVIAVSEYTKALINKYYGTSLDKISVVHNGIYPKEVREHYRKESGVNSKAVLFLGRVTFQKGPDYFVEAAKKVIEHIPDVLFVLAGSGDMLPKLIERVHELNIEANFLFPGFLKGEAVDRAFSSADLYVMPSVSEPFGISALEAINCNIPVIMSKQSGVSEVIAHALKFDFWDVNRFADLIINSLVHKELREDLVSQSKEEIKAIRWDASASKTIEIYNRYVKD